ncbi:glucosidase family protein [Flavobacterium poyangense]|uniref:hypothetical protein n=1 Tax=Flavobacterium poyangense TaxID=2204302 RepID=UPI00142062E1|nr:hypothetical protein [Flavobacterium sp. JXAS1]
MKNLFSNSRRIFFAVILVAVTSKSFSQENSRWGIEQNGSITWQIKDKIPHHDHIEMSGRKISAVIRYGVGADGSFNSSRSLVWPMLRTIPNNTHASFTRQFAQDAMRFVLVNQKPIANEKVESVSIDGTLLVKSKADHSLELTRRYFPSTALPVYCEKYTIRNTGKESCEVEIPKSHFEYTSDASKGTEGSYTVTASIFNDGTFKLQPNDTISFSVFYSAGKKNETVAELDIEAELRNRLELVRQLAGKLILETPDPILNTEFEFAKLRAAESIFETKGGPMHGPGGESYYAAIWANDQAEYIGPFFPYLGYDYGNKASLNAYLLFAKFMNKEYKPIPSSIVAEGTDIWDGAGDRGDAAMIAYGAGRYALSTGNVKEAEQLWPLIEWCLEYCRLKLNSDGVVNSDSDELEGRFPAGKANLNTSSLYYDALNSAVYLGQSLGKNSRQLQEYKRQSEDLKKAIEKYFGAEVEGFQTYKYYKENKILRAWICTPLTMGIFERKKGTIDALFSPKLWTPDGLASAAGDKTFWDRSTLYALRGVLAAGETDKAIDFLHYYSQRRLLGDHVPYPVEAYPEGNQRHLSAESGLYCRVFTEGLFGIRPVGLNSFDFIPRLPKSWSTMSLRKIHAFEQEFDITVTRVNKGIKVKVSGPKKVWLEKVVKEGDAIPIKFEK